MKQEIYLAPAPAENCIQGNTWRFTLMTDRLVRMEYSPDGSFEDRATQTVVNRQFPPVSYRIIRKGEGFELYTDRIHVIYDGKPFSKNGLSAVGQGGLHPYGTSWHYGDSDCESNLKGTVRTLDTVNGACELEDGILSLKGCSVLDDSHTLVMTENGWVEPRIAGRQDLYVFLYGNDYEEALDVFYQLTGKTPMLPRYALGNWWSRYYKYTEKSYMELMDRFAAEQVPFSVAVIDMDWHLVNIDPRYGSGWTGYTWNPDFFPDPQRFLAGLHARGMQTTLNVHPADGVRAYEKAYPALAAKMGVDTEKEEPVNFDIADPKFLEAYFNCVLHPLEEEGVDFWWIDWQQGNNTKIPGLDPLWMLNHFHFQDSGRNGKRPMTFSRYAGPGSHRYPIGFSGDTHVTWESLDFQPYFTATASNIGYGWWSHDIGGHMQGYKDNVLALRWLQLGVFSPINRLHSTDNEFNGKEPWRYPMEIHSIMNDFLRLRHQLIPYLYTMNYLAWNNNQPLIRPLYYLEPLNWNAYQHKNEYYFGTELLAAPITTPQIPGVNRGKVHVWIPEGLWFDFFTGWLYRGGRELSLYRSLTSFPLLAKAGAIVPMTQEIFEKDFLHNPSSLTIRIFAGADGSFILYEDDNTTEDYQKQLCVFTTFTLNWERGEFQIAAVQGDNRLLPKTRTYTLEFCGFRETPIYLVQEDGTKLLMDSSYDTARACLKVTLPECLPSQGIRLLFEQPALRINDTYTMVYDFLNEAEIPFDQKTELLQTMNRAHSLPALLAAYQSMDLSADLQGILTELLTADA